MGGKCVTKEECAGHHGRLLAELREIRAVGEETHRRLFVDNGTPCVQTRLNRHEAVIRALLWVVAVVVGAVLTGCVAACFAAAKMLARGAG